MRVSVIPSILIMIAALPSCSFKQTGAEEAAVVPDAPWKMSVNWVDPSSVGTTQLKSVQRDVHADSATEIHTQSVVTLPAQVPEALTLVLVLPTGNAPSELSFARSEWVSNGISQQLGTHLLDLRALPDSGNSTLSVQVSGLTAMLESDQSSSGSVQIELFTRELRALVLHVDLRTPPSQISVESLALSQWDKITGAVGSATKSAVVTGTKLNLIRALKLSNSEATPVEMELPRRPSGQLLQNETVLTDRDTGCSGPGFAIDSSPRLTPLSQDLLILPLGDRMIPEAEDALSSPQSNTDLTVKIESGDSAWLGIYAIGAGADNWLANGPKGDSTVPLVVPGSCHDVCVKTDCSCMHCALMRELLMPPMCVCTQTETHRDPITVFTGIVRGAVELDIPATQTLMTIRYSDLDIARDGETRPAGFIPQKSGAEWSQ